MAVMSKLQRVLPGVAIFLVTLVITALACLDVVGDARGDAVRDLAFEADQLTQRVEARLAAQALVLRSAAGFMAGSSPVLRIDWRVFVETLNAVDATSGVQGIGFAAWIPPGQLGAHVAAVRAEGFPDYRVWPEGRREAYSAIVYLEPFADRNLRAFGYDMYAEPVRQAAMARARDTGAAALSGKVKLVQETGAEDQAGTLLYVPVYRPGRPVQTVAQRHAAFMGWTYSPLRMADLMNDILKGWRHSEHAQLRVRVHDGRESGAASLMFGAVNDAGEAAPWAHQERVLEFGGHAWTLVFERATGGPDYSQAVTILVSGLMVAGLLGLLAASLLQREQRAHEIADQLTADVQRGRRDLEVSELRWKFALEGSGLGVWDWHLPSNKVYFSPVWKSMLGYAEAEVSDSRTEWSEQVHPEDLLVTLTAVNEYLTGRAQAYDHAHRMRCKDGSYKWIRDRGMVIERAADGTPVRMIGTHSDVTESTEARLQVQRLARLYAALSECNAAIVHCRTEAELLDRVCRVVVEHGGIKMAWFGLVEGATGRVLPVARFGTGTDYLDEIEVYATDVPLGRGPAGTCIRENQPVWLDDFLHDLRTQPWHERGARYGWNASAGLPIRRSGPEPVGALILYASDAGLFDAELRALLEEMARQISFALGKLETDRAAEESHARMMEAEQRFRSLIEQSVAGACIAQGGRFVYVNPRMREILGYGPDDDLAGKDVLEVVAPKDREEVLRVRAELASGRIRAGEWSITLVRKDGGATAVTLNAAHSTDQGRPATIATVQDIADRKVAEAQIRRYAQQLERTFMQTVAMATTLSEMRDPYTTGYERRVAEIAVAIGREMGFDEERLTGLRIAGYLHDVGKTSVPAEILAKPGVLSEPQRAMVRGHVQASHDVLKAVDFPWPVAEIARQHHERMDGSGYPQGLKGDAILPEARVLAVADVVEAMASHRPYRAALGVDKALAELERGRGSAYDPVVVDTCLRLFREKGYRMPD